MIVRLFCLLALLAAPTVVLAQDSRPTSRPTSRPASVPLTPVTSQGGLTFTGQEGWEQQKPSNSMRVVQYRLPGEQKGQDATLVVYYFGGDGGGVEANLQRWYGQISQPDGSSTAEAAKRTEREVNGMKVTLVDVTGTYSNEMRPGMGGQVRMEGARMLAAIFETASGPHFVKLVGPAATVEHWKKSFDAFVDAVTVVH